VSFHLESIPNRTSKPAILLRQAWREGKRIRKKTIANLSSFPPEVIDGFRTVLKGGVAASAASVLAPDSKLATARRLSPDTADSSLGALLRLGPVSGNEMLAMLDWLLARQRWIETSLANRHLRDATLILYDVSSSYLEGRLCPLAAFGYNRDGKRGKQQIVFGLLCSAAGCPVAVEVFAGGTIPPGRLLGCNRAGERPGSLPHPHGRQAAHQETLSRFGLIRLFSNPESNQFDKLSRCFTEIV